MTDSDFALTHRSLAFNDYKAGRFLFLNGYYMQALVLCSTALEKYLKAMLSFMGKRKRVHLDKMEVLKNLFADTPYHFVPGKFDEGFFSILGKAYKYRYYDIVSQPESIGFLINQFLGELDYTVNFMEKAFIMTNEKGEQIDSEYQKALKEGEAAIVTNNYLVEKIPKKEFMNRISNAYALHINPNVIGYEVIVNGTNITPFYTDKINLINVKDSNTCIK